MTYKLRRKRCWIPMSFYVAAIALMKLIYSFRPAQPTTHSGTENEYRPKCDDAVRLVSNGRHGSLHIA